MKSKLMITSFPESVLIAERISSIQIENFRSIKDSEKISITNFLNLVIGKNESGKSNFLDALEIYASDNLAEKADFRYRENNFTISIFYKFKTNNNLLSEICVKKKFYNNAFIDKLKYSYPSNEAAWKYIFSILENNLISNFRKKIAGNFSDADLKDIIKYVEEKINSFDDVELNNVFSSNKEFIKDLLPDSNFGKKHIHVSFPEYSFFTYVLVLKKIFEKADHSIFLDNIFFRKRLENLMQNFFMIPVLKIYNLSKNKKEQIKKFLNPIPISVNEKTKDLNPIFLIQEITNLNFWDFYKTYPNDFVKFTKTLNSRLKKAYQRSAIKEIKHYPYIQLLGRTIGDAALDFFFQENFESNEQSNQINENFYMTKLNKKSQGSQMAFYLWLVFEYLNKKLAYTYDVNDNIHANNNFRIFLLDEPTNNLHETSQINFIKEVEKHCDKKNYFFIATHSQCLFNWSYIDWIITAWRDDDKQDTRLINACDWWQENKETKTFLNFKTFFEKKIGAVTVKNILDLNCDKNIFVEGFSDYMFFYLMKDFFKNSINNNDNTHFIHEFHYNFIPFNGVKKVEGLKSVINNMNKKNYLFIFDDDDAGREKIEKLKEEFIPEKNIFLLQIEEKQSGSKNDFFLEDLISDEDYDKLIKEYLSSNLVLSDLDKDLNKAKKQCGEYFIKCLKEKNYKLIGEKTISNFMFCFQKIHNLFKSYSNSSE